MAKAFQTNRRRFVQGLTTAGAAAIILPSSGRALGYLVGQRSPIFATIGLRNQGWEITTSPSSSRTLRPWPMSNANVLAANQAKAEKAQGKKPDGYKDYRRFSNAKTSMQS